MKKRIISFLLSGLLILLTASSLSLFAFADDAVYRLTLNCSVKENGTDRAVAGDEVRFTDMRGNSYLYQAALVDTLEATDISGMTSGEYPLSLFTCNLSGSARVTVRCVRKQ